MNKIKSSLVAAIAVISLASTFVLPTFANPASSTNEETNTTEESNIMVSTDDDMQFISATNTPNTGVTTDGQPTNRINNTGLLITIAALSIILGIYSMVNIIRSKSHK